MPTPRGLAQEENAIVVGDVGAKAKPKAVQKPAHPWQWYLTPAGIQNEARALAKQVARINKGYTRVSSGTMFGHLYMDPKGRLTSATPAQRDILYGGVVKPIKTVANLAITGAQKATNGWKPADPESSPAGRLVKQADRQIKSALGMQQDEQRRPEDLFWQQMGEMASTSVVGGYVAHGLVPAAAFTTGAFKALAPTAQQALRWTAGVGTESVVSTALTDNSQGNVANFFGENAPLAVKPEDDMVSALGKSLIPNAGAEITLGLGFLGATKTIGRGLEGFDNVRRRQSEGRAAKEATDARNFTKEAGLQNEADGDYGFTEQSKQPTPAEAAPTQAAPTEAAPVGPPPTQQQAEDALLGPKGQSAEEEVYSPELPEVDTAVMAADRLDDEQLRATAQGTGPVLPELERQLTEQKAGFQPQEGLTTEMVAAPTENLATPTVPYEDQWSQLPNETLFSLASPANNPELFDIVSKMTGRSYDQFTWTDVVDGLKVLREQGTTILPSRVMDGSNMSKTSELWTDAVRFQYKEGVNAKGQQKGNSLEGVTKWNPDVEQTNLIWDDPGDGKTYVVNGHNSKAKAEELGIPTIPTKRIFASTAAEARLIGAKANIASGGGTAFDAAKIIRELGIKDAAGLEAAGIPLDSGLGASGLALSNLPDNLFQRAINGDLSMGRALTLGGSGLDAEGMTRVVQLAESRDMTERGFAELAQMASSAPKVESGQMGLFGPEQIDTTVIKAELVGKVKAELTSNKNLMSRVGKSKSVQALAEKGGTQVNQAQVASAADITKAVLAEFDKTKYAAETPISTLLNQGAADIAAGAKPGVIAKRILQQLEMAAEAAPPAVKAPVEEPAPAAPAEPGPMTPQERKQLKAQVVKRAIENGEVRPSATPLPDLPDPPQNLDDPAALLADEARLAQEYGTQNAIADQLGMDAKRQAMGWSDMSLDQKKANGMLDEWERPKEPVGDGLDERAAYAREQRMAAEASGDVTLAREWQNAERRLEKERIAQTQQRQATSQQDMFGVGAYDDSTPLLNGTPEAKQGSAITPGFTAGDRAKAKGGVAITPAERVASLEQRLVYAKEANNTALIEDIERVLPRLRKEAGVPAAGFVLPKGLADLKPRYGYRDLNFEVSFGNDFDRAAFSLAGDVKGTSAKAAKYRQAFKEAGYDIKEVTAHGQKVKAALKEQAQAWKPDPENRSIQALELPAQAFEGGNVLSPLSDINQESKILGLDAGPIPFMDMPTTEAVKTRRILEGVVTDAVKRITGREDVAFHGYTQRHIITAEHGGDGIRMGTQSGFYDPMTDMVNVMGLMDNSPSQLVETGYHESFHRIQYTLLTQEDMAVFDSAFGKIRVNDLANMRSAATKATIEKQAYAFQVYASSKAAGEDVFQDGIRAEVIDAMDEAFPRKDGSSWEGTFRGEAAARIFQGFDKVMDLIERVNNGIRGRGFESVQSLYEKAFSGELAETRALDYAAEMVTPDQRARIAKLSEWKADNQKAVSEISQMAASIDEQINALKSQAMAGGC